MRYETKGTTANWNAVPSRRRLVDRASPHRRRPHLGGTDHLRPPVGGVWPDYPMVWTPSLLPAPKRACRTSNSANWSNSCSKAPTATAGNNELWTADRGHTPPPTTLWCLAPPEHVRQILKKRLHWTSQKPSARPANANDKEVRTLEDDEWRESSGKPGQRQAHVVFLDESASP